MAFIPPERGTITCTNTPSPCPLCYSTTQILAAIAYTLCVINNRGTTGCDPATLMLDAKCYKCDSDKEKLSLIFKTLATYASDLNVNLTISELLQNAKCLECSEPGMIKAIIVKELCDFFVALES